MLTGPERSIQNAVAGREGSAYAVARSGTLIYLPNQGETVGELVLLGSSGSRVLAEGQRFEHPQFSNDGKLIAVTVSEEGKTPSIRIYGIESDTNTLFSDDARFPLWNPDDQWIMFMKQGVGLIRKRLDGAKPTETWVHHESMIVPDAWINQGRSLVYHSGTGFGIRIDTPESGNEPRQNLLSGEVSFPISWKKPRMNS